MSILGRYMQMPVLTTAWTGMWTWERDYLLIDNNIILAGRVFYSVVKYYIILLLLPPSTIIVLMTMLCSSTGSQHISLWVLIDYWLTTDQQTSSISIYGI